MNGQEKKACAPSLRGVNDSEISSSCQRAGKMPFTISVVGSHVGLVRIVGMLEPDEMPVYKQMYSAMYDKMDRFIIVFDTREMAIPSLQLFAEKVNLLSKLKHRTCSQVMGAVVLTEFDLIKTLVSEILKMSGQAAPFAIVTSVSSCITQIRQWITIANGKTPPGMEHLLLKFSENAPASSAALLVLRFLQFMRHFLSYYYVHGNR